MAFMRGLRQATLIRRYKRFLTDVELEDGKVITVHCPNTGSMKNCVEAGAKVWLSKSDNPKRKYQYTWEYMQTSRGDYIGINAARANYLAQQAIENGTVSELSHYETVRREVRYGKEKSRIDLLLTSDGRADDSTIGYPDCYVEVKSVTLLETPSSRGIGYFPDAVSERGAKHLRELLAMVDAGHRAVLLYCVQHTGIQVVRPADHIDSKYGDLLRQVHSCGVEILAYKARKVSDGFRLNKRLPVEL
jgi:sugar fermentation stimulation protein A